MNAGITSWLMMKAPGLTAALMNDGNTFRMECQTLNKPIDFRVVNSSSVTLTPLQLYPNGVVNVGNNVTNNKVLVLYDFASTGSPATSVNFYGFGVNGGSLRYQTSSTGNTHRFFCGDTLGFTITNTGGSPASDARFKTELQPIEGALEKIS